MKKTLPFLLALALGICLGAGGLFLITRATGADKTAIPANGPIYTNEQKKEAEEGKPAETPAAPDPSAELFNQLNGKSFDFASGAGGWRTSLTFGPDGTFTGNFSDADMGDTGDGYPNGTLYVCNFSGSFAGAARVDDFTWSVHLKEVNLERAPEETEIIDGVRYIYANPYGLDDGDLFYIYLPGRSTADLPEQYMLWVSMPLVWGKDNTPSTLPFWGMYNVGGEMGFFSSSS